MSLSCSVESSTLSLALEDMASLEYAELRVLPDRGTGSRWMELELLADHNFAENDEVQGNV
jgi:hypothetical protein